MRFRIRTFMIAVAAASLFLATLNALLQYHPHDAGFPFVAFIAFPTELLLLVSWIIYSAHQSCKMVKGRPLAKPKTPSEP